MSSSIWSLLGGMASGGLSYLSGASDESDLDPFNIFTKSESQKLAEDQWEYQRSLAEKNYLQQVFWTNRNYQMQKDAFQYQKDLNAMQMEREDTAVQRRVADLKAAGLSPTLAAGSAASATPVHAGSAPQGVAPQFMIGENPKIQAAMFKESMQKDRIALAMSILSNMADVSRTKAETEFIAAQKDKLVQESPVDLALKEIEQEYKDSTLDYRIAQEVNKVSEQKIDILNKQLDSAILADQVTLKAYEVQLADINKQLADIKLKYADDKEKAETESAKVEVKSKLAALHLADLLNKNVDETGVHPDFMTNYGKTIFALSHLGNQKPQEEGKDYRSFLSWVSSKVKGFMPNSWRSPKFIK